MPFLKIIKILLVAGLCLNGICFAEDNKNKKQESFYSQIKRCVVRLEHSVKFLEEGSETPKENIISDGTAFFVKYKQYLYIVTARHVVEKDYDLHARVPVIYKPGEEDKEQQEIVLMKLPKIGWIFHSEGEDAKSRFVDIAVMKIYPVKDRNIVHFVYLGKDDPKPEENQLPENDSIPPQEITIFGFPTDIGFELQEQRPFGRRGIISFVAEDKFIKDSEGKYFETRCFITDAEAFPGNSGSPVVNVPSIFKNKVELLGLIIATNNKQNFSIGEPVSRIREVLEYADKDTREPLKVWHKIASDTKK